MTPNAVTRRGDMARRWRSPSAAAAARVPTRWSAPSSSTPTASWSGRCARAGGRAARRGARAAVAGARARGATMYCTLEPCCHIGRTGPCARRIVEAGIARVVAAMRGSESAVPARVRYLRDARRRRRPRRRARPRRARLNAAVSDHRCTRGRPFVIAEGGDQPRRPIAAAAGARTRSPARRRSDMAARARGGRRHRASARAPCSSTIRCSRCATSIGSGRSPAWSSIAGCARRSTARLLSTLPRGR